MHPLYLICGVPAAGKSWVCRQLKDKFHYIPHDKFIGAENDYLSALTMASKQERAITECPFGERDFAQKLQRMGIDIRPYFVVETPHIVAMRYFERNKKECPKNVLTRASSIGERARDWNAPYGTSAEVLSMLEDIDNG